MGEITNEGFNRKTQNQYVEDLENDYLLVDPMWNIAPDTPDGQLIGIFGATLGLLDEQQGNTYNSFDPDRAQGIALDSLCKICNITRQLPASSVATVTFTGLAGTLVPEGTEVEQVSLLTFWRTIVGGTIEVGATTIDIQVECTETGPNLASINTITKLVNPIAGIEDTCTNAQAASVGNNVETDSSLRIRRYQSVSHAGTNQVDSMFAEIANLTGVLSTKIYENDTNITDADGFPPHSLTIFTEGGDEQEIAQSIYYKKNPGCELHGVGAPYEKSIEVTSTVTGNTQNVTYNLATVISIAIKVMINRNSESEESAMEEDIKDEIRLYAEGKMFDGEQRLGFDNSGFPIGSPISATRLFTPVNKVQGQQAPLMTVTAIWIGKGGTPDEAKASETVLISLAKNEWPQFLNINMDVEYTN